MKICDIELIVLDVDGVLTNGLFAYAGKEEIKFFHARDGLGMVLARLAGIKLAFLTGRESESVKRRAEELRIDFYRSGVVDKQETIKEISAQSGIGLERIAYVGDDLNDIPAMEIVGWTAAVHDATAFVKERVDYTTVARGGEGAVREVVEKVLRAKGLWEQAMELYLANTNGQ